MEVVNSYINGFSHNVNFDLYAKGQLTPTQMRQISPIKQGQLLLYKGRLGKIIDVNIGDTDYLYTFEAMSGAKAYIYLRDIIREQNKNNANN